MSRELALREGEERGFEFAVESRLRHGALWRLVKKFGTQAALARHLGIRITDVNRMVNMRHRPPMGAKWWPRVMDELLVLTGQTQDELFPEWSQEFLDAPRTSEQFKRVGTSELLALPDGGPAMSLRLEHAESAEAVKQAMKMLSYREQVILKMRFGFDGQEHTWEEIAWVVKVTKERVRQIYSRAVNRLWQHKREMLAGHLENVTENESPCE